MTEQQRPTREQWRARLRGLQPVRTDRSAADLVRERREERERETQGAAARI